MIVYLITNTINGKRYVGQTRQSLVKRWVAHCSKNRCRYLYNAIQKYGRQSFNIESIIEVLTRELANEFEIEYIERYKTLQPNGYNICTGGDNRAHSWLGKKHLEASKLKMSLNSARRGKPGTRLGARLSEEAIEKIRQAHLGLPMHSNTKAAFAIADNPRSKGRHWKLSPETIERMRQAQRLWRLNGRRTSAST